MPVRPRLLVCLLFLASTTAGAADAPVDAQSVMAALERPVDFSCRHQPLGDVIAQLAEKHQMRLALADDAQPRAQRRITCSVHDSLRGLLCQLADRAGLVLQVAGDGGVVLAAAEGAAQPPPEWVENLRPVREMRLGGGYRTAPPLNGWTDPVAPLGDGDEAALAKPTPAVISACIDGYVDRIEAHHLATAQAAPELIAFFRANPAVRREFWLALSPQFDDAGRALDIMEELRAKGEKRLAEYHQLAIAIAVVFDSPDAAVSSRGCYLWAVSDSQFAPPLAYTAVYDYFTDAKNQAAMVFRPKDMVWPMMVHLVDLDVTQAEIDWARGKYAKGGVNLQALYSQVPYDNVKLGGTGTQLGDRPYVLENLLTYGGVCVDQAHYASRVAKVFGVPSMKCAGHGRYGGMGHAWSGYLGVDAKTRFPQLSFTGRYQYDYYYIGKVFDPHTRCEVLDRDVELLYAGVSGKYEAFVSASALTRAAIALEQDKPALSLVLTKEALKLDPLVADAGLLAMRHAATATLPLKEADQVYHRLVKALANHPDVCRELLATYLDAIPGKQLDQRQKLYAEAYAAFGAAKRPDLQIRVRLDQLEELSQAERMKDVVTMAFETVGANVKEGALVMPLVAQVVALSKHFAATDRTFQVQVVKDGLQKFAADFPKKRGNAVSPAWQEYEKLMGSL
jgi:hypothetical protein